MNAFKKALLVVCLVPAVQASMSIGDSQKCENIQLPAAGTCGACTVTVTAEEVAPIPGLCDGANAVKITLSVTCAGVACQRSTNKCRGSTDAVSFCCNGCRYHVALANGATWGGEATGVNKCSDIVGGNDGSCN